MNIAEKLITVAENVPKVFKAGQLDIISNSEALKGSASGSSVTIKDISPVEHDVSVKLSGLPPIEVGGTSIPLPTPYAFENDAPQTGMTWTVADDGTITIDIDGTKTSNTNPWFIVENLVLPAGEYVLSGIQSVTAPIFEEPWWSHDIKICDGDMYRVGGDVIKSITLPTTNSTSIPDVSFTLTKETAIWIDYMYGSAGTGVSNVPDRVVTVIKPEIKADVTYLPADYSDVKVQRLGKNLLNAMKIASQNNNTDYVKDTENNSFTMRGNEGNGQHLAATGQLMLPYTNTANISTKGIKVKAGLTYVVSFDYTLLEQGKYNNQISVVVYKENLGTLLAHGSPVSGILGETVRRSIYFKPNTDGFIGLSFRINNNYVTLSNIQVEEGSTATEFEPYIEPVEFNVDANGNVQGNTYLYPSMTLMTDTDGVTISAEYIKDIDKTFNTLITNLALTGGN